MNRFQVCIVMSMALVALAAGAPTNELNTAKTPGECVKALETKLTGVTVPEPIQRLIDAAVAAFPPEQKDWNLDLSEAETQQFVDIYPNLSCEEFPTVVGQIGTHLRGTECERIMASDKTSIKQVRASPVVGPLVMGKEACFYFEPQDVTKGLNE